MSEWRPPTAADPVEREGAVLAEVPLLVLSLLGALVLLAPLLLARFSPCVVSPDP